MPTLPEKFGPGDRVTYRRNTRGAWNTKVALLPATVVEIGRHGRVTIDVERPGRPAVRLHVKPSTLERRAPA